MTEIKKLTKILLLVDAIIWFIFGTVLTFLYDMFLNPEGWTNPYFPRMFGGINYVSAVFATLMLLKKDWEEIKLTFAYFIGILTSTLIIEISVLSILGSTFGASMIQAGTSTIILEAVLLTLGIVVYIKQRS
jgi:predicted membrane channel-forming protein YqfA (hemolysin III family)